MGSPPTTDASNRTDFLGGSSTAATVGGHSDRAGEGSDSTPPDIPADGSYADPDPHRARLDFEGGAGAGAPRGPVDNEVEEEGEKPMSTPPLPATSPPDATPSSPDDDSESSEDSVVGRGTAPDQSLVMGDDGSSDDDL